MKSVEQLQCLYNQHNTEQFIKKKPTHLVHYDLKRNKYTFDILHSVTFRRLFPFPNKTYTRYTQTYAYSQQDGPCQHVKTGHSVDNIWRRICV